jgi:hypothetical protein
MTEGRSVVIRFSDEGPETVVAATSPSWGSNVHRKVSVGRDPWGFVKRTFRQVGWLGQTGNVYRYDEEDQARANEPGGYGPMYIEVTE